MTTRLYSSISQETTLSAPLNNSATTMSVVNASGLLATITPASPAGTETFVVVIDPDTALEEIVEIVYPSTPGSNTLTIQRNIDSSTAQAHSAGAAVRHMAIGRDFRDADHHIRETTTAHGLTLANVTLSTGTGNVSNTMLASNSVTTAKIADSNVTADKIAAGAITSAKIADGTIATGDIADSAITTGKIAAEAVTTAKIPESAITNSRIAADAVTSDKIAADAVGTSEIADGAVTSAKIADATIVNADVSATAAISKTKLNLGGTITSADLVDGTIVAADIADGTITAAKMVTDPYARANHTGSQTASTISDFNTAVRTNRLDQMAAPTASVALGAQKITGLADPTSAQDAVTINYISGQKGVANGLASLDSTGLIPQSQIPGIAIHSTNVVNSQAAMLALSSADAGDLAVRTDVNKTFVLTASPASTLGNWQELLTPTDSVTSVDGNTGSVSLSGTYLAKAGGTMTGNLTLAGAPTSNLHAATKLYVDDVAGSATAAAASAAAAATTYDNFDDRYLGSKSSAPSVDNDGNSLITGALYWNSVTSTMFAWTGSAWGSISSTAAIYRYRFTAAGGETSESGLDDNGLTLSYIAGKEQVYLNGVLLVRTTDYNATNGTSITGLAALTAGDVLEIITFTAFDLATAIDKALFDTKGDILVATAADTPGKLTVGTNGYYLKADSTTATGLAWGAIDTSSNADIIMTIMGAY